VQALYIIKDCCIMFKSVCILYYNVKIMQDWIFECKNSLNHIKWLTATFFFLLLKSAIIQ